MTRVAAEAGAAPTDPGPPARVAAMTAALALWRASHPGPTLVVSSLAVILGVSVGLDATRLVLLAGAVFAGQLSVGWSNDAIDARRDAAVHRPDKPIARGDIAAGTVGAAAAVALVTALGLSVLLGPGFLAAHAVALASAWAYNAWLKRTAASVAPFVLSFGLFPSLATLALPAPTIAALWAGVAGASLGVAVHFSNVLPDLADDAATGVRGLPHRIGAAGSAAVAFGAVIVGAVAVLVGPVAEGAPLSLIAVAGTAVVVAISVVGLRRATTHPDRIVFRMVMLAGLVLALVLAASGLQI